MTYQAARTPGTGNAPLVFTLHGTGGDEFQFHGLASQLIPGATVVSPRGNVSEAGMNRYFRRTGEGVYDMEDLRTRTKALSAFLTAEKEAAGADRVIALGYSNGANILASVAFDAPELFDDLILIHPLIPWRPDPQAGIDGRRILITAGRHDPICPASLTEDLAAYLRSQGADLAVHWHEGGHEIQQEELVAIRTFLA